MMTGTATRISSQNRNLHYCNHFATIPSLLTWQWCGSVKPKKISFALNLGGKMKIHLKGLMSSKKYIYIPRSTTD